MAIPTEWSTYKKILYLYLTGYGSVFSQYVLSSGLPLDVYNILFMHSPFRRQQQKENWFWFVLFLKTACGKVAAEVPKEYMNPSAAPAVGLINKHC